MKTEKKKVYIYIRSGRNENNGKPSIEVSSRAFDCDYCSEVAGVVSAPLTEIEIDVPSISGEEAIKVLSGALLESLIEERQKLQAETNLKLMQIDKRISDLQAIEFKGDDNDQG